MTNERLMQLRDYYSRLNPREMIASSPDELLECLAEIDRLKRWTRKVISLIEYEDLMIEVICELDGHDIGPDQCGIPEHDLCYRCGTLRTQIEEKEKPCEPS